jgi:hypothetical protein
MAAGPKSPRLSSTLLERFLAKPTHSAAAMGFATSSDLRPIWSLYPSYPFLQMMSFMESINWLIEASGQGACRAANS